MDTKEIIKRLRRCSEDGFACPGCPPWDNNELYAGSYTCVSKLMQEAAAALEEQQNVIKKLSRERDGLRVLIESVG